MVVTDEKVLGLDNDLTKRICYCFCCADRGYLSSARKARGGYMQDRWTTFRIAAVLVRLTMVLSVTGVVTLAVMTPGRAVAARGTATITRGQTPERHHNSPVTPTHAKVTTVAAQESAITLPNSDGRLEQFWRGSGRPS